MPQTDGRRTTDKFRFHELCWHSQAELKIPEKSKTQNFKNPKQYLCEDNSEKKSEKVWKDSKVIWGRSSVLKFLALIGSHVNMVNTKTNKNSPKFEKAFFFQKFRKSLGVWPRGSHNWNLKVICSIGYEIITTRTTDDRQRPYTMSSADVIKQS